MEKSLAETEEKMKELSLRYENITSEKENLRTQLGEEKERCEKEMNLLRQQVDAIKEQYFEELAEWEKICAEVLFALSQRIIYFKYVSVILQKRLKNDGWLHAILIVLLPINCIL